MIKVLELKAVGDYRLRVRFSDGTSGLHDFANLVASGGPMVQPLKDPTYFARAFLDFGAPTWPNGFDLAPEWLRREMSAAGELSPLAAE